MKETMPRESVQTLQAELRLLRDDFKNFVSEFKANVMPRSEIDLRLAEINKDIAQIKLDIVDHKKDAEKEQKSLEAKIGKRSWVTHTLTAVFTALLVLAMTYIFNDITKG